jgi:Xaa-Pro aminopeptidase
VPEPASAALASRHARVRSALSETGADALIVTHPPNIRYLSNHGGTSGTLVLTTESVYLLVDFRYEEAVRARQSTASACPELTIWPVPASYDEALVACLLESGVRRPSVEAQHLTVGRFDWLTRTMASRGNVRFGTATGLVEKARMIKDAWEVAALREAARRLTPVAEAAIASVAAGRLERDIAGVIEGEMRQQGFERIAFDTIVGSGPNSALPHYRAGDRSLEQGDLVVLDFGGVLDGYCSDLTRTVCVGALRHDEARHLYDAVLEAQQLAVSAVRPGVTTTDIDAAARTALTARGLGDAFGHGTGHGLGLEVHEEPRLTKPRADIPAVVLEPGMVFTVEPGAYLAGRYGVRIEDDVLVTETGYELLTAVPKQLLAR